MDFATIDLISEGRAEIIAGRASRIGLYELLGYNLHDYEVLFEEKLDLLLRINEDKNGIKLPAPTFEGVNNGDYDLFLKQVSEH